MTVDPNEALQAMAQPGGLRSTLFSPTSRYYGLATATLETPEDKTVIFLTRRFIPQPERFVLVHEHVIAEGERLDNISARYLGDPLQFWRICDANAAMSPAKLTETVGFRLKITLPEGIQGVSYA